MHYDFHFLPVLTDDYAVQGKTNFKVCCLDPSLWMQS